MIADPSDRLQHSVLIINITGESSGGVKARKLASKKRRLWILRLGLYDLATRNRLHPAHLRGACIFGSQTVGVWLYQAASWKQGEAHLAGRWVASRPAILRAETVTQNVNEDSRKLTRG